MLELDKIFTSVSIIDSVQTGRYNHHKMKAPQKGFKKQ